MYKKERRKNIYWCYNIYNNEKSKWKLLTSNDPHPSKVEKCNQNNLMENKRLGFVLQMVQTVSKDQTFLAVCGDHKKCEILFSQTANLYRYVVFFYYCSISYMYFENYSPLVKVDQKTIAGETLIAKK